MIKKTVLPGLVITERMYELARAKLRAIKADVSYFTFEYFTNPLKWRLIPDPDNPHQPFFKAEFDFLSGPPYKRTIKINLWFNADIRRNGQPSPHNHPWWNVEAHVVMGGYKQDIYRLEGPKGWLKDFERSTLEGVGLSLLTGQSVVAGGLNFMDHEECFHEVTFAEPGTLSIMDCGPSKKEAWGYYDPDKHLYVPNQESPLDARHKRRVRQLNKHLLKKK